MEEEDKGPERLTPYEIDRLKKLKKAPANSMDVLTQGEVAPNAYFRKVLKDRTPKTYSEPERIIFQTLGANTLAALDAEIGQLWKEDEKDLYNPQNYLTEIYARQTHVLKEFIGGGKINYLLPRDADVDSLLMAAELGWIHDEVTGRKNIPPTVLQVNLLFTDLTGKHPMSQANFPRIHETVVAVAKKLGFVRETTDPSMIQPMRTNPLEPIMHGFDNPKGGKKLPESKSTIYAPKHLRGQPYTMEFMFHDTDALGFRIGYTPKKPSSST